MRSAINHAARRLSSGCKSFDLLVETEPSVTSQEVGNSHLGGKDVKRGSQIGRPEGGCRIHCRGPKSCLGMLPPRLFDGVFVRSECAMHVFVSSSRASTYPAVVTQGPSSLYLSRRQNLFSSGGTISIFLLSYTQTQLISSYGGHQRAAQSNLI